MVPIIKVDMDNQSIEMIKLKYIQMSLKKEGNMAVAEVDILEVVVTQDLKLFQVLTNINKYLL